MKINPNLKYLPTKLKDPKCFEIIENELLNIVKVDHKHKTAKSYSECVICRDNRTRKQLRIQQLGFKNYLQYLEWKRVMQLIINNIDFDAKTIKKTPTKEVQGTDHSVK